MHHSIHGSYVALPTPFLAGRLDLETLEAMIERLAHFPVEGILIAGTTGEVPTLNDYEHRSLIHAAVDYSRGRMNVMAGVGTNCTRTSVELARFAASSGVDSLMAVTPYYNRPSKRGLMLHYGQIAEATSTPLVLYNVPHRTGLDLTPDVAAALHQEHASIVAIKEASGSPERIAELRRTTELAVLCGDDATLAASCAAGAVGAIGVVANLAPAHVAEICRKASAEDTHEQAQRLQLELMPLIEALALDINPVPIKAAMASLGLCKDEVRAPLAQMGAAPRARLLEVLESSTVIPELQAAN